VFIIGHPVTYLGKVLMKKYSSKSLPEASF